MSNKISVLAKLKGENINMTYKDGTYYEIRLVNEIGESISNAIVKMNINGVFYYKTTDSNGIAKLNINLNPGKYIITSSCDNSNINTWSNTIKINSVPPNYNIFYNVSLPLTFDRTLKINVNNKFFNFTTGTIGYGDEYYISNNKLYFISSYNPKLNLISSMSNIEECGFVLFKNNNYLNILCLGNIDKNVNQFSVAYVPKSSLAYGQAEEIKFIINNKVLGTISVTESLNMNHEDEINAILDIGNQKVLKTEKIRYKEYDLENNGFEIIHSFTIANTKITDSIMMDYASKTAIFPVGAMKGAYGTFLTGLTIFSLNDILADYLGNSLKVNWNRPNYTIVMVGANANGAFVHTPDSLIGMNVMGDLNNTYTFKFFSSLMLSDWEQNALNLAGLYSESPLSQIMSKILESKSFTMSVDNETYLIRITVNESDAQIIVDLNTGIIKCIISEENFTYKGAISNYNSGCYRDILSNKLANSILDFLKSDLGHDILGIAGNALIPLGLAALGPAGISIGGLIIVLGAAGIAYDSGLFEDFNMHNLADFFTSAGLSIIGGTATVGLKTALSTSYRAVIKYAVSKRGYKVVLEEGIIGRDGIHSLSKNLVKQAGINLIQGEFMDKIVGYD